MKPARPWLLFLPSVALALFSGCERAASTSARVSLELPGYNGKATVGSQACTTCLKQVVVNVFAEDMRPVSLNLRDPEFNQMGTELAHEVELEIPVGKARQFQILTFYKTGEETSSFQMQYGEMSTDLQQENETLDIQMSGAGSFEGGTISGRVLTGTNSGPTGKVTVVMQHPKLGIEMILGEERINNGWFTFMASQSTPLSYYTLNSKLPLFDGPVTTETLKGQASAQIAHVKRPSVYYADSGTTPHQQVSGTPLVYGFFGNAEYTAGKRVCVRYDASPYPLSKLYRTATSTSADNLTFAGYPNPTTDLRVDGGLVGHHADCVSTDLNNVPGYSNNVIALHPEQFNGVDADQARGMAGVFNFGTKNSQVWKLRPGAAALDFELKTLPGLFSLPASNDGTRYDSLRLFRKGNAPGEKLSRVTCESQWLSSRGYNEVTGSAFRTAPVFFASDNHFQFSLFHAQTGNEAYIACPALGTEMKGSAGAFLGAVPATAAPTGNVLLLSACTKAVSGGVAYCMMELTNSSPADIEIVSHNIPWQSTPGIFVLPLTQPSGGTCGIQLAAGQSCTFKVHFDPTSITTYTGNLHVQVQYPGTGISGAITGSLNANGTADP